jgi:arginase family enzyme
MALPLPLLRALAKKQGPPGLIHFDAHLDTWPENFGQTYAHGSVFYHAISEGLVQPQRMVQIGVRSPVERQVHDWTLAHGVVMITAQDVHEQGPAAIVGHTREVIGDAPVYLSFDIDVLDPAFAPGTGTPEIGGLASWQAQAIVRQLRGLQFIGMDLVLLSQKVAFWELWILDNFGRFVFRHEELRWITQQRLTVHRDLKHMSRDL